MTSKSKKLIALRNHIFESIHPYVEDTTREAFEAELKHFNNAFLEYLEKSINEPKIGQKVPSSITLCIQACMNAKNYEAYQEWTSRQ